MYEYVCPTSHQPKTCLSTHTWVVHNNQIIMYTRTNLLREERWCRQAVGGKRGREDHGLGLMNIGGCCKAVRVTQNIPIRFTWKLVLRRPFHLFGRTAQKRKRTRQQNFSPITFSLHPFFVWRPLRKPPTTYINPESTICSSDDKYLCPILCGLCLTCYG